MNLEVQINPSPQLRAIIDAAPAFPMRLLESMARALTVSGQIIVANAVKYRFTSGRGPFPIALHKLGRVTGRLRQSITATKPQIEAGTSTVTMAFGSNVNYFGIHEFGFTGSVPVKAHTRRNRPVRAHSRLVKIAAREPMQTELNDTRSTDVVIAQVTRSIRQLLNEMENGGAK